MKLVYETQIVEMNKCKGGNIFVFDISLEEAQSKDYSRFYNEMDLTDGKDYWECIRAEYLVDECDWAEWLEECPTYLQKGIIYG
jgi:hypothetical protein